MWVKKFFLLLVLGVILGISCQPVVVDDKGKGTLSATRMTTVKAEPDFNASDVATVNKDERLILIYTRGEWYRVRLHNQMEGWIHKTLVKTNPYRDVRINRELGLRWKPTESSAVSQIVPGGTQLRILQDTGEWILLQPVKSDNMGWVSRTELNSVTGGRIYTQTATDPSTQIYNEGNVLLFTNTASNIRSGPSTQNSIVTRVKKGAKLGWQQSLGDWYSITVSATNQVGYIYRPLVTTEPYRTIENIRECNFRAGPGLNYLQIDRLPKGTKLKLLDVHYVEGYDWYLVERPSTALAWVRSDQTNLSTGYTTGGRIGKTNFGFYFVSSNANVSRTAGEYGGFEATLVPGQHVEILASKTANWYQVKYSRNKRGFIQVKDVTGIRNKPLTVTATVNFRENSSTKSAIIDRVPAGSHVMLIGVEFGWCYVTYGDKYGWISGQYLIPQKYHSAFVSKEKSFFRPTPSTNAATLGDLAKGEEIIFFETRGNWYRFQEFDSKQSVWISNNEVDLPAYGYGYTSEPVTPRSGPGIQYPQAPKRVTPNIRIPIIKEMLEWYQIMIPGHKDTGWIPRDVIKFSKDRPLIALDDIETVQEPDSRTTMTPVEKGSELLEFEYKDGWHHVAAASEKGWASIGWIQSNKVAPTRYGQITLSRSTGIYYGPGNKYARKRNLTRGISVQIVDMIDGWYQIDYFNETGWIKGR